MLSDAAQLVESGEYRKAWSMMVEYETIKDATRQRMEAGGEEGRVQLMIQSRQYEQLLAISTILTFHAERRYWEALGIDPDCNSYRVSRIHRRYRKLAGLVHPDTCQLLSKEVAKGAFIALQESRDAVLLGVEDQLRGDIKSSVCMSDAEAHGYEWWSKWDDERPYSEEEQDEKDDDLRFLHALEVDELRFLVRKREQDLWNQGGEGSIEALARARNILAEKVDSTRHACIDQQQGGFL